jgi:hypothetical protein
MTEMMLDLMTNSGVFALFVVTFLSCLRVHRHSPFMMLASGSFCVTGDPSKTATVNGYVLWVAVAMDV